ncbi:MAG TPA: hypothetical protein VH934_02200 [Xanthobacteraceae bacterium]|jgi:hypothetical protein
MGHRRVTPLGHGLLGPRFRGGDSVAIGSGRASWLHGATLDLDGGEIPVL